MTNSLVRNLRGCWRSRALLCGAAFTLQGILITTNTALGVVFTVTNGNDAGPGSLRAAITQANAQADADEIQFNPALSKIIISTSSLDITGPLRITGNGAASLTIENQITNDFELFSVDNTQVTISHLTIQQTANTTAVPVVNVDGIVHIENITFNGHPNANAPVQFSENTDGTLTLVDSQLNGNGAPSNTNAAIDVLKSQLTVERTTIQGFYAQQGSAITSDQSQVTLKDSTIRDNVASLYGAAIFSVQDSISISRTVISNNRALEGGAISALNSSILIDDSYFKGNSAAKTQSGGAIWVSGNSLTIRGTTLASNSAQNGGAVLANDTVLSTVNATFSGNTAMDRGGAIYLNGASSSNLSSTTLADNIAGISGGALYAPNALENTVVNSVFSRNSATTSPNIAGKAQISFSFISNDADAEITPLNEASQIGVPGRTLSASIGPLSENNGLKIGVLSMTPVPTHAIQDGSSLINAGDASALYSVEPLPGNDQRGPGFPRVRDGGLDIGAVEFVAAENTPTDTGTDTPDSPSTDAPASNGSSSNGSTGPLILSLLASLLFLRRLYRE